MTGAPYGDCMFREPTPNLYWRAVMTRHWARGNGQSRATAIVAAILLRAGSVGALAGADEHEDQRPDDQCQREEQ